MFVGLIGKLPIILTFCLLNTLSNIFLPANAADICATELGQGNYKIANRYAGNRNRRYYQRDGYKGTNGRTGRNGRSGQNQTISVDGSSVNLNLSGTNGEDGEDGENAYRPRCPRNRRRNIQSNIYVSNGADGGRGGKGGDGGNGGSLTVYYSNLADLKKVSVRANGGEGGRGGRGGLGTLGCTCRRRRWKIRTCTGTRGQSNYRCTEKIYRCYDGKNGRNGMNGRDGKRGDLGTLTIINSKKQLRNDQPTQKVTISQLITQKLQLSKNKWQLRQGATSLLATGSIIADEYREFVKRLEGSLKLIWQEKQPITKFANQTVKLSLNDTAKVEIDFPESIWVNGSSQIENQVTKFTVNHAIPKQEVRRLAISEFAGMGKNLNLKIVDLARKSDVIKTQFKVIYRASNNYSDNDHETFYEGKIPDTLVTRNYNRFTLALGQLKIPSQALSSGVDVDIEIVAIRSLGGRSVQKTLLWRGTIRN